MKKLFIVLTLLMNFSSFAAEVDYRVATCVSHCGASGGDGYKYLQVKSIDVDGNEVEGQCQYMDTTDKCKARATRINLGYLDNIVHASCKHRCGSGRSNLASKLSIIYEGSYNGERKEFCLGHNDGYKCEEAADFYNNPGF